MYPFNPIEQNRYKISILASLIMLLLIPLIQVVGGTIAYFFVPETNIVLSLSVGILVQVLSYYIAIYLFYWRGGNYINGARRKGVAIRHLALLAIGFAAFASKTLSPIVEQLPQSDDTIAAFEELASVPLLAVLMIVIIAPVFEEIIFRDIIFKGLRNRYNQPLAIVVSSLLFGAFHLNYQQFVTATILGAVCALIYIITDSVRYTIIFHAMYNLSVIVVGIVIAEVPALEQLPFYAGVLALIVVPFGIIGLRRGMSSDRW